MSPKPVTLITMRTFATAAIRVVILWVRDFYRNDVVVVPVVDFHLNDVVVVLVVDFHLNDVVAVLVVISTSVMWL